MSFENSSITVSFKVKRNAHNGFDACRYFYQKFDAYVNYRNNTARLIPYSNSTDPITQLYDNCMKSCPELSNKHECQLVYHGRFRCFL